jgi:hypothetical protein
MPTGLGRILLEPAQRGGVAVLGLQPPDEPGRRIRDRVDRIERRREVGDQRTVHRREQPSDVDLREHVIHGAHAARRAPTHRMTLRR